MHDDQEVHEEREMAAVRAFHEKFGFLTSRIPVHIPHQRLKERITCMCEELGEFIEAAEKQSLPDMADALIDLVYFAKGTAVMMGLPWEALWDDVQRANMSKVRGIGKRGHQFDCVKPDDWQPPVTDEILRSAGYQRDRFENEDGTINEERCYDHEA